VRLQAAQIYKHDVSPVQVAHRLRVSTKSAYQWRRRWRACGEAALASKGPGGSACRLNAGQLGRLRAVLDEGPAAWGWDQDQRWTLARVTTLIARLSHVRYTLRGTSYLLHRLGYSPQVPVHRAAERNEKAIAVWKTTTWVKASRLAAATGAYICFEDEAGQNLRPPKAKTWAPRGHTRDRGVRQRLRPSLGGGPGLLPTRRAQPPVLPGPRPPRPQRRAPLDVRSRLRRPDRRRA